MKSSISWIDFSEQERRKMMGVVRLFQEQDTRDEIGIALIRDTLAEILFPGTGSLQTRARYFLFVPWLLRRFEERTVKSSRVGDLPPKHAVRVGEASQSQQPYIPFGMLGNITTKNSIKFNIIL